MKNFFKKSTPAEIEAERIQKVLQLSESIQDLVSAYNSPIFPLRSPLYLARYLEIKNWDVPATDKFLQEHFQWRGEQTVDTVQEEYFPQELMQNYPCGFYGYDKDHCPVYCESPGACDVKLLEKYNMDLMLRWHICIMEKGKQLIARTGGRGITVVCNAEGTTAAHRAIVPFVREIGKIDEANYPIHIEKVFIINTNAAVRAVFDLAKMFVRENTRNKVHLLGGKDNYIPVLLENGIALDRIPEFFGGSATEEHMEIEHQKYNEMNRLKTSSQDDASTPPPAKEIKEDDARKAAASTEEKNDDIKNKWFIVTHFGALEENGATQIWTAKHSNVSQTSQS